MTNDKGGTDQTGYLLIDQKKCQGCLTCMLICSLVHAGKENLSLAHITVRQSSLEKYPNDVETRPRASCDLCQETPFWNERGGSDGKLACVEACPVGAIRFSTEKAANREDAERDVNFRGEGWKKIGYPVD